MNRLRVGDRVYGTRGFAFGACAENTCMLAERGDEKNGLVAPKPANLTYDEAAAVPVGGTVALNLLRKGQAERGKRVLYYGASGSAGTFAVRTARAFGAR